MVVLNETKEAERIISEGEVGNKPTSTIFLLSRYYRQKVNLNKQDTICKLNDFMTRNYKNYNPALWEDVIENIVSKAHKYKLREIDYVEIFQSELDTISKVNSIKYEKLLFTMLCFAKLYNMLSDTNNGWVNTDIKEIYKTSRVNVKHRNDKFLYLNDLEQLRLISFSNKNDNLNLKINFIEKSGNTILKITDFRELGYEYLNFIGEGKFERCKCCDRLFKKTSNNMNYCNDCQREITKEKTRIRVQKYRENSM